MANISRQRLAQRLLHNWINKNPLDSITTGFCNTDDDVQSLGWLLNLNADKENNFRIGSAESHVKRTQIQSNIAEPLNTVRNSYEKPPYSYATLITMAINSTTEKKINISSLYLWISENFPYFKMADNHWKNSIRHNLSLNKRFEKVARRPNESGKGGFWRLTTGRTDYPVMKRPAVDGSINPAKRIRVSRGVPFVSHHTSGYNFESFTHLQDPTSGCFNWSSPPSYNTFPSLPIKCENVGNEEFYHSSAQSPTSCYDVDDDVSRSFLPSSPCSDVTSEDLSCFDDLLVFNCPDKPATNEREDGALDLCMPLDGNGGHDWWEKALDLSEECDVVSEKKRVRDEGCQDIYIPPLDDIFTDICHMYALE